MYYIVNHTQDILAADNDLLKMLSVNTIGELHKKIALNEIAFTSNSSDTIEIKNSTTANTYQMKTLALNSILGEMTLITLNEEGSETFEVETSTDDTFDLIDEEKENIEVPEEKISFETEDELPFDLITDDETPVIAEEEVAEVAEVSEETTEEPEEKVEESNEEDTSPIFINITEVSQKIGISTEDYNEFLNEYIDTALTLEDDLKSSKVKQKEHAITTLSHLSNVLYLPVIEKIMTNIENSNEEEQAKHIQDFYQTLARLTTTISQVESEDETEALAPIPEPEKSIDTTKSFGTIDLSDVKPIHFDFQLEEAANDLSLPIELIEEFVVDFIEQAHVETKKMLKAYEEGDLDTIQKIGHLLKGTSSNLRINPLSDTLYKIQFCEESSQLEDLIKDYWGHFLSFEHQIDTITK